MNKNQLTKEMFVEVLEAAGINNDQQHRFHEEFEKKYPEGHHQLLQSLAISKDEINRIRKAAK